MVVTHRVEVDGKRVDVMNETSGRCVNEIPHAFEISRRYNINIIPGS